MTPATHDFRYLLGDVRKPWPDHIVPLTDGERSALRAVFPREAVDVLERIEAVEYSWKREGVAFPPSYGRESADEAILPWSIPRTTGWLLYSLILASHPRRILELGTSFGYSTLWLCQAARDLGTTIETVELMPEKADQATENLRDAGYDNWILHKRDAKDVCREWKGTLDFVFMDADADSYPDYWDCLASHLSPNAVVVADHALTHPHLLRPQLDKLVHQPELRYFIHPIDNGLLIASRVARPLL